MARLHPIKKRFPNAELMRGPDGTERWYVEIPEGAPADMAALQLENTKALLERRTEPVSMGELARVCGVSRVTIWREIHAGRFPEGSVLKVNRALRIAPWAALWYFESVVYDPLE